MTKPKKKKNLFYSSARAQSKPFIAHAWDTETDGLGGDLSCITACSDNPEDTKYYDGQNSIAYFLDYAFNFPHSKQEKNVWFAHNAQYDLRYIIEWVLLSDEFRLSYIGLRTDSDIFIVEIVRESDGLTIRVADSFAFFPSSLEKFAGQFGGDYKKITGPDFEAGERFDPQNPEHIAYARNDSAALLVSIRTYQEIVEQDYGVSLGYTAASTALRAWQATIPAGTAYFKPSRKFNDFFRSAYYGGIVFLTDTNPCAEAVTYDINSSYPAQMRKGVPAGRPVWTADEPAPGDVGFFECEVIAPDDLIVPIVPHRTDDGKALLWTRGKFKTTLSTIEIFFAREHGYKIKTGKGALFLDGLFNPCNDFVDKAEGIRKAAKGTARETVAKAMQNSLYGKYCAKEQRRAVYIGNDPVGEGLINAAPMRPDDPDFPLWLHDVDASDEMVVKPEWGAWITANARITLLSTVYALGPANCLYGDTDSITVRPEADHDLIDIGPNYGQYKKEKTWEVFRALGPKLYAGIIAGEMTGKSKGQNRKKMKASNYNDLLLYGTTKIETVPMQSLMSVLKKGRKENEPQEKNSSSMDNNQSYALQNDGSVRPIWEY